ncbi:MAG: class I mannose-6-phosphate isomerase [Clostridia bacterium]|nr:class I mannose-6-phosphate isomerase [Clostridia bacterium]
MKRVPIKLSAISKQIIWGGNRLREEYNKKSDGENIAESWELTVRGDGMNTISGGEYDGWTMEDYLAKDSTLVTDMPYERFPLLIKFIDAEADLSIQVHPDDAYGLTHKNDLGKTEMWYILDAKPGAKLVYGLKDGCSTETLKAALENGTVEEQLNYVEVKKGETYFIPHGLVHAIGAGILLAEIQQNSNITYRVYDYNRRQKDGSLRELHVEDALNVILTRSEEEIDKIRFSRGAEDASLLAACEYFTVNRYELTDSCVSLCADASSFHSVLCVDGEGYLTQGGEQYALVKGDSYFVPAGTGDYEIRGTGTVIVSRI